jgi:hypothetical protein
MVIPGSLDESELWLLIKHGDMPPKDSSNGPLDEREKEMIQTWITAAGG